MPFAAIASSAPVYYTSYFQHTAQTPMIPEYYNYHTQVPLQYPVPPDKPLVHFSSTPPPFAVLDRFTPCRSRPQCNVPHVPSATKSVPSSMDFYLSLIPQLSPPSAPTQDKSSPIDCFLSVPSPHHSFVQASEQPPPRKPSMRLFGRVISSSGVLPTNNTDLNKQSTSQPISITSPMTTASHSNETLTSGDSVINTRAQQKLRRKRKTRYICAMQAVQY